MALDTEKAERKVWVVRVPPYVAQRWHEAIARSGQAAIDEDVHTEVLGQITLEQGVATTLTVPGEPGGEGPQLLHMNSGRDAVDTAVLSYDPGPPAAAASSSGGGGGGGGGVGSVLAPKVDGAVHKRYDAGPVKIEEAPAALGGPQPGLHPDDVKREAEQRQRATAAMQARADAAYLHSSRKRLASASRAPAARKVAVIDDIREVKKLAGGGDMPLYTLQREKAKAAAVVQHEAKRRVRMSRDELEAELFKKFGEQPLWHFVQLQKEIDQPIAYLKEVLNELAVQIKRGPNKDLWELKKHLAAASRAGVAT